MFKESFPQKQERIINFKNNNTVFQDFTAEPGWSRLSVLLYKRMPTCSWWCAQLCFCQGWRSLIHCAGSTITIARGDRRGDQVCRSLRATRGSLKTRHKAPLYHQSARVDCFVFLWYRMSSPDPSTAEPGESWLSRLCRHNCLPWQCRWCESESQSTGTLCLD